MSGPGQERVRVLRVIARLNVGGPAHHVTLLSADLDPVRYTTLLLTGATGAGEGSSWGLLGDLETRAGRPADAQRAHARAAALNPRDPALRRAVRGTS